MASEAFGRGPVDKQVEETQQSAPKHGDLHRDVEVGQEMIDIDRIEGVYK
jgi:hypothetical protein